MSNEARETRSERRMARLNQLAERSKLIAKWGLGICVVFVGLMVFAGMMFNGTDLFERLQVGILIGAGIGLVTLAIGVAGVVISGVFTMSEVGASVIDSLFDRVEGRKPKPKRTVKSDE